MQNNWLKIFFAISACSWMPHWSCHYYKLETGSTFIVGPIEYSNFGSAVTLVVYTLFIMLNLFAIVSDKFKIPAALITGIFHLAIASLHIYRLFDPFPFVVFGSNWSLSASLREAFIVGFWGLLATYVFLLLLKNKFKPVKA